MEQHSAIAYFEQLAGVLRAVEVTDARGASVATDEGCERAVTCMATCAKAGGKLMLVGNGGSSAIVAHMQADLCNTALVRTQVFHDTPVLTALSNDFHYQEAFERGVTLWATSGDVLYAVSSSGKSLNILNAVKAARNKGCKVVTLSGFKPDNPLRALGDLNFYVASERYGFVELAHSIIGHYITDRLCAMKPSTAQ